MTKPFELRFTNGELAILTLLVQEATITKLPATIVAGNGSVLESIKAKLKADLDSRI